MAVLKWLDKIRGDITADGITFDALDLPHGAALRLLEALGVEIKGEPRVDREDGANISYETGTRGHWPIRRVAPPDPVVAYVGRALARSTAPADDPYRRMAQAWFDART